MSTQPPTGKQTGPLSALIAELEREEERRRRTDPTAWLDVFRRRVDRDEAAHFERIAPPDTS
jgi:hypothetical protein